MLRCCIIVVYEVLTDCIHQILTARVAVLEDLLCRIYGCLSIAEVSSKLQENPELIPEKKLGLRTKKEAIAALPESADDIVCERKQDFTSEYSNRFPVKEDRSMGALRFVRTPPRSSLPPT